MLIKKLKTVTVVFFIYLLSVTCYAFPSDSIYNLDCNLTEKNGNIAVLGDLSGKVQIFSMIYTNCKTICPIIIANMKSIEKLIAKDNLTDVNFSLVSLDPDRDTVDTLSKFFKEKKMNDTRWRLFKSTKSDTLKLALTLGIKYKKEKNNEYTHSNLIIILDKNGVIRMHHQGLDKNFTKLISTVSSLTK